MLDVGCSARLLPHQESAWFLPGTAYPLARQMAVESKPLFHPEVLRQQVRAFNPPAQMSAWQPKLQHWADLIASGRADEFKESELLPDFLTDVFYGLLGYTGPAEGAGSYTLSRERHVEVDGEFADAVLGRFGRDKHESSICRHPSGGAPSPPLEERAGERRPHSAALPVDEPLPVPLPASGERESPGKAW